MPLTISIGYVNEGVSLIPSCTDSSPFFEFTRWTKTYETAQIFFEIKDKSRENGYKHK
jgi:hypothetical protein